MSRHALLGRHLKQANSLSATDRLALQIERIRDGLFKAQIDYIDDLCNRKVVLCPRRAGKTYAFAAELVLECLQTDSARCAFVAITRGHASQIIWDTLKRMDGDHSLNCQFNETTKTMTFPNNSVILLGGADTAKELEKYRGVFFHRLIIDEAASFYPGLLGYFIYDVVEYTLMDEGGSITVGGTPGVVCGGQFYDMTGPYADKINSRDGEMRATSRPFGQRGSESWEKVGWEWSFHKWSTKDNLAKPWIWERMENSRKARGISVDDPTVQREQFAVWVEDRTSLVYSSFDSVANTWIPEPSEKSPWGLPEGHKWRYVCGVDLGYDDDFSLQVTAWADTCDAFYHVYGFNSPGLVVEEIANKIKDVEKQFGKFEILVGDRGGLGKLIFQSLSQTYGVNILPASKNEKKDAIANLNSEFKTRRAFVIRGSNLANQLSTIQWDENRRKEHSSFANHDADAYLYNWRHSYHHFRRAQNAPASAIGSDDWAKEIEQKALNRALQPEQGKELVFHYGPIGD